MYHEAFQVLLKGLDADELSFAGKFYRFDKVPMILHPVQRPHPPLWYGVGLPENADWPAQNDVNIICACAARRRSADFRSLSCGAAQARQGDTTLCGVGRHRRRRRHRRRGARHRAPRLSALARELLLAVRAQQLGAARRRALSARRSTRWRRSAPRSRARPRPCAISSPRTSKATGANYWTPWLAFGDMTAGRSPALGRLVRQRGDAGIWLSGPSDGALSAC